jgi:GAF domain-containing protein
METRLSAVYDLGQELLLLRDANQITEAVLEIAARVLGCPDSDFLLVDEARSELYVIARRGQLQDAKDLRLPLDGEKGITVVAARSGQPVYVPDVRQDPRYVYAGFPAVSELTVPVQIEGRLLGVLNVESAEPDAFSQADQELLSILASQAALALENARLHAEERRRVEQMTVLNELARRISASLDLQATLEAIVAAAAELIPCALAEISLWDEKTQRLTLRALQAEPCRACPPGASYPPGHGYTGWLVRHKKPLLAPDVEARQDIRPHLLSGELPYQAYAGVPLLIGQELIGILVLIANEAGAFNEGHIELLQALATQAAEAIRNARLYEELTHRHRELAALCAVAEAINRPLDLGDLLQHALDSVLEVTHADGGAIRLLDPDSYEVVLAAQRNLSEDYVQATGRFPLSQEIVGWVARTGEPSLAEDMWTDPRVSPEVQALLKQVGHRSLAAVPLRAQEQVVGTLSVGAKDVGYFTQDDLKLLNAIGQQVGVAIANAQLFEETQRNARRLTALNAVASAINQPLPLQEIMDQAIAKVIEVMETEAGGIRLLDQERGELVIVSSQGLSPTYIQAVDRIRLAEGIVGRVALSGEPLVVTDMARDPRLTTQAAAMEGFHTFGVVPLRAKDEIVGTLGVVTREPREFSLEELDLLIAMGHQIGVAIENARLYSDLAQRARELVAVHAVAAAVNRPGDLDLILAEGLQQVLAVTGFAMGAIALRDRQGNTFALKSHQGMSPSIVAWLQEQLVCKTVQAWPEGQDLDIEELPPEQPGIPDCLRQEGIRLSVDAPLFAEGELVGLLSVATRQARPFTSEERSLLQAIGHQLGTAIANARLRQEALAAERLAAVGRVATSVAHDLRSPLGGILRSAEFLARPELSPGTREKLSQAIVSLARRLINATQGILDYVQRDRLPLRRNPCQLAAFLDEVLAVLEVDFCDQGIEVVTDCGYRGAVVMDADRMAQVVYNIAANARDAMPRGGAFTVATRKAGERIELRFTDTGPGVPEALGDRIFEPFVTHGKREGAGLGLSIARRIVEEHGGELWMESPKGQGATFVVSLPT